jgi:DUF4097 and DUF4098 domain-containing protein YvlB
MLLALILLLTPITAQSDQWSKDFKVDGTPRVRVATGDAHVRITAADTNTIQARITTRNWKIGGDGIQILDRQNGDEIELEVRYPKRWTMFDTGNRRVDIELRVPRLASLNIKTGDGNIDLNGVAGDVDLQTGDGRLEITDVQGTVRANTGDGPVKLIGGKGEITLQTGDGRIEVEGFDGTLRVETGDGRVRVSGRFDVLEVKTGDGGVEAIALNGSRMLSDWSIRTGDGGLTMRVPPDLAADVELHTNDGNIDLGLPVTISGRTGKHEIKGQLNGGGKLLSLKTGDGSIKIDVSR